MGAAPAMDEITRSNRPNRPRKSHPVRTTLLIGLAIVPALSALTFVGLAYASTHAIRLAPVSSEMLEQIVARLLPAPTTPVPVPSPTALPTFLPPAVPDSGLVPAPPQAPIESPTPTATPTAELTASPTATPSPSLTPTFTSTPTFTATPTGTATWTPSPTATRTASHTATRTPSATATRTPTLPASATPTRTPTLTATPTLGAPGPSATASVTPPPSPTSTVDPSCTPTGNAGFENTLLGLINQERTAQSLPAYTAQNQLQAAARLHSTDMVCNDFFSHTGSDGSTVGMRVNAQGYSWSWVGENILATSDTSAQAPQSAFDWWMNSALHRANLLSPNYTEIGLGYIYVASSPYGGYFTAVFARP